METTRTTSDLRRQEFLDISSQFMQKFLTEEKAPPFLFLADRLSELPGEFERATDAWHLSHQEWQEKIAMRLLLNNKLSRCVRDFVAGLRRRTVRYDHPEHIFGLFKAPNDGNFPHVKQVTAWQVLAKRLIRGDKMAVAKGYPAMSNPDVAEIALHLEKVNETDQMVREAQTVKADAQEKVQALRPEIDSIKSQLYHYLSAWLSGKTDSARREMMRNFGFGFQSGSQEQPAEPAPEPEGTSDAVAQAETLQPPQTGEDDVLKEVLEEIPPKEVSEPTPQPELLRKAG